MARPARDAGGQLAEPRRIIKPQDFLFAHLAARQFRERQIDPAAFRIPADVAQNIRELQGFAEINRVIPAGRILVAENFDAEQPDDRRDPVAIQLELLASAIPFDVEIHFHPANELVEVFEREMVLPDCRLQFPVDGKLRSFGPAGAAHVGAPGGEPPAPVFHRDGFVVGRVVHFAAERIKGGHGIAFGFGQQNERERQIGGAFAGDRPGLLHDSNRGRVILFLAHRGQAADFGQSRIQRAVRAPVAMTFAGGKPAGFAGRRFFRRRRRTAAEVVMMKAWAFAEIGGPDKNTQADEKQNADSN